MSKRNLVWMNECVTVWMYEWMNEWIYEWVNEWISVWINEWTMNNSPATYHEDRDVKGNDI